MQKYDAEGCDSITSRPFIKAKAKDALATARAGGNIGALPPRLARKSHYLKKQALGTTTSNGRSSRAAYIIKDKLQLCFAVGVFQTLQDASHTEKRTQRKRHGMNGLAMEGGNGKSNQPTRGMANALARAKGCGRPFSLPLRRKATGQQRRKS